MIKYNIEDDILFVYEIEIIDIITRKQRIDLRGGFYMAPTAVVINRMLENLEEEDFQTAITFIQFLADTRKKKKAAESEAIHVSSTETKRKLGIGNGKYMIPNNIDECNDEIAEMFGVDVE